MSGPDLLGGVLRGVSRSFYLSLRVLPRGLRAPIGLAYLLARAADTLADRPWAGAEERRQAIESFRGALAVERPPEIPPAARTAPGLLPLEGILLDRMPDAWAALADLDAGDRRAVEEVVRTLIEGMRLDLDAFAGGTGEDPRAIEARADLDRYTYLIAGVVGEFWSVLGKRHRPALAGWDLPRAVARGVRYGKGLQLTNILRDIGHDAARGRVYLPLEDLARAGLAPRDVRSVASWGALRPLVADLAAGALDHLDQAWAYVLSIPGREMRFRLASLWPLLIALETLAEIVGCDAVLDPGRRIRVPRRRVYRILASSAARIRWNRSLEPLFRVRMERARRAITPDHRR
ncbi:MAG: squalene/phytoene synthase family protein [Planctomycetes bacterium]|nr:squalene/phytoene synthase family protein [Planctomycetota bacterium]